MAPAAFPGALVIPQVFARRPDLGCLRDLPCFAAALLPYVPRSLRRPESWVPISSASPPPVAFPSDPLGRLLHDSQHRLPLGVVTTQQASLDAAARLVARPPGSFRPDANASAAEDIYARAFPGGDRSSPESGITTPHHWRDTVTGLSPAGALPLQAARVSSPYFTTVKRGSCHGIQSVVLPTPAGRSGVDLPAASRLGDR